MILSDYVKENGEAMPQSDLDNGINFQGDESEHTDLNDVMHQDEEMEYADYDINSDDESEEDTNEAEVSSTEDGEIGDIAIGLSGARLRYKVCMHTRRKWLICLYLCSDPKHD